MLLRKPYKITKDGEWTVVHFKTANDASTAKAVFKFQKDNAKKYSWSEMVVKIKAK